MKKHEKREICPQCESGRFNKSTATATVHSNVRPWKEHLSTVWTCPSCASLVSLEIVDLDVFYADYPITDKELDGFARQTYKQYCKWLFNAGLDPSKKVLDYACSTGPFIKYLKEQGIEDVSGYDPYVEQYNDRAVLDKKYDFIIAQDVIEHVENPGELFSELANYLAPGGVLCIGTPRANGIDLSDPEGFRHELHQPYHICILSEQALLDLGHKNNLESLSLHRRLYVDTPIPFINWTFLRRYLRSVDNTLNAGFEDPHILNIVLSPSLLFFGFFGYWFPVDSNMLALFRSPKIS